MAVRRGDTARMSWFGVGVDVVGNEVGSSGGVAVLAMFGCQCCADGWCTLWA